MSTKQTHSLTDWHKEDIKAAIRKKGATLTALALANGYTAPRTFSNVFQAPYPKVQRIIADFIGVPPEEIWPSRYQEPIKIKPSSHRDVA
tara:strand:+ start:520 stop:789 length:270 start_codon:yes stop_codon:yes gene_type:complete